MNRIYLVLISFVLITATQAQIPTDNKMSHAMDSAVNSAALSFFKDSGHVGLSVAIWVKGKLSFYNYGTVDKKIHRLPTAHSMYEIGSVTKTFTGSLLAKAVMQNKVQLDEDIRKYLREPYPNLEFKDIFITLRQLSTHQSGLPNNIPDNSEYFKNPDFDMLPFQLIALEKNYNDKRYRDELHQIKPDTIPGSVYFKYSNIGEKLVGFILEDVYQKPYRQLLSTYITTPLKMKHTVLSVKDSTSLVKGYGPGGKLMPYTLDNAGAAGGLRSCTDDMSRYLAWQMNEKDPWIKQSHTLLHGDLFYYARGYNWNMEMKNNRKKIWQSGGTYGMSSAMIMYPHEEVGFVLLANDAGMNTQEKLSAFAESIINKFSQH